MAKDIVKTECPVCKSKAVSNTITRRERAPILQNRVFSTAQKARDFTCATVHAVQCIECSFVWNSQFDPNALIYDEFYDNDVSASSYYQSHLEDMATRLIAMVPSDQPIYYAEIGCGEAGFMRLVKEMTGERCRSAIGFDPSYSGADGELPQGIEIIRSYFGQDQIHMLPRETNLIASRHTIEHIAQPRPFAKTLADAVTTFNAALAVETPDVNWIFEHGAFQDFFFEHCSLFNPASISHLFAEFGLNSQTSAVYDGQYMWSELRAATETPVHASCAAYTAAGKHYSETEKEMVSQWVRYLMDRRKLGAVAIWGAASKGVTFSLLLDSHNPNLITHAIDLNVKKQGAYLPISAKPVCSPDEAMADGVNTVVIMNPNYEAEITKQIAEMNWDAEIAVLGSGSILNSVYEAQ